MTCCPPSRAGLLALALFILTLSAAPSALAAETYGYFNRLPKVGNTALGNSATTSTTPVRNVPELNRATTDAISCAGYYGSGGFDEAGAHYSACGTKVLRLAYNGTRLADVTLPAATHDVAPSPDGYYIYFVTGTDLRAADNNTPNNYLGHLWRMVRSGPANTNSGYVLDQAFTPERFNAGLEVDGQPRKWFPKGMYITTDAFGDIYFSNGSWNNGNPNMILKYAPDGKLKTQFGDYADALELGKFRINMGIAVTRDGRSVYIVEQTNSRVQRFDYKNNGSYEFAATWGSIDTVNCATGKFAAPYDIGLDPWNYVYVMDTTCGRVQKFTALGQYLATTAIMPKYTTGANAGLYLRMHGISVDARGNFAVLQDNSYWKRGANNPEPGPWLAVTPLPVPDTQAPVLTNVTVPAETITRNIAVGITANDNVGITEARIAGEDGYFGNWLPVVNGVVQHTVSAGYGVKAVTVQVRDAAGNESGFLTRTVLYRDADNVAPTLTSVALPATTATRDVIIQVVAADNVGVTQAQVANEDGTWGEWKAFNANLAHTLTAGYGIKGVTVKVRDAAGNESVTRFAQTNYQAPIVPEEPPVVPPGDVADPVLVSATIPPATVTRDVTITTEATDDKGVTRIRFANEDGTWGAWQTPYAAQKQHTLTVNAGPKAVFVQVGDAAGKESNVILLRTALQVNQPLPQDPPPGPAPDNTAPVLNDATVPAVTGTQTVNVTLNATDNVGVAQVRFANEDGTWGAWSAYAAEKQHTLTAGFGAKAVFIQVRDAAGNESTTLLRRTSYQQNGGAVGPADNQDPVLNAVTIPAQVAQRLIDVGLDATDDVAVTQVRFANEDGVWEAWKAYAPVVQHGLSAGRGPKAVFVQVKDAAGRESNVMLVRTTIV